MRRQRKIWRNRRGQGLTEYALLICLVSLGLILLLGRFRNAIGTSLKGSAVVMNGVANITQAGGATGGTGGTAGTGFINGLVNAVTAGLNAAAGTLNGTGTPLSPVGNALTGRPQPLQTFSVGTQAVSSEQLPSGATDGLYE